MLTFLVWSPNFWKRKVGRIYILIQFCTCTFFFTIVSSVRFKQLEFIITFWMISSLTIFFIDDTTIIVVDSSFLIISLIYRSFLSFSFNLLTLLLHISSHFFPSLYVSFRKSLICTSICMMYRKISDDSKTRKGNICERYQLLHS